MSLELDLARLELKVLVHGLLELHVRRRLRTKR